jgi:hypothetical protein
MSDNGGATTVGVAMIARNAETLMPLALDPIQGHVDAIAIVLGGESSDKTAEMAEKYATLPVEPFSGPVDEQGRLMSFAAARNQSFDILRRAGMDYAFVVDTDDQWQGIEHLHTLVEQAAKGGFPMVMIPYSFDEGSFLQPRLYEIASGHWEGPCHNYWEMANGRQRVALQSNLMHVRQERPEAQGKARREQNIAISEAWMTEHGDNCRLLLHMAKDLMVDREVDRALAALDRYFGVFGDDARQDPEELYNAHHAKAGALLIKERFNEALFSALNGLAVRPHAQTWTLASEAALWTAARAKEDRMMLKLAEFCANQALEVGKPRSNLHWHSERLSGAIPLMLKARALAGLGEFREARGALDLALLIEPENKDIEKFRRDLCRRLGELD